MRLFVTKSLWYIAVCRCGYLFTISAYNLIREIDMTIVLAAIILLMLLLVVYGHT